MTANHGVEPLGAYEKLADELGFLPPPLLEERLLRFLDEEGIPVYDYDQVDAYMAALAESRGEIWIWRPFRHRDVPEEKWEWRGRCPRKLRGYYGHGSYIKHKIYGPYDKVVPIHILRHVKKIQDKFGDHVLFFVSDYAVPNPDPFIMVTARGVQKIIFGFWDEPGYGTEPEE